MSKSISHIPHLDALRAFAALIVVTEHFFSDWTVAHMGIGRYGVDIFFTISGFLITSILLTQKLKWNGTGGIKIVKNFFVRRVLRLFPVYYLFLIGLVILSVLTGIWIGNKKDLIYYFTYTPNILFFIKDYQSTLLDHTWSLGIEEQFYLIWPWLIIFVANRFIPFIIYGFTLLGFIIRSFTPSFIENVGDVNFLPVGSFHTLGIGAIIAYWIIFKKENVISFLNKWNYVVIIVSVLTFAFCFYNKGKYSLLHDVSLTFATGSIVFQAYAGYGSFLKKVFDLNWLQYLGKISYGLYLYHKPIPLLIKLSLGKAGIVMPALIGTALSFAIAILVAHFSWKLIEKPILKLKEKFDT